MSGGGGTPKSSEELRAEIEALSEEIRQRGADTGKPALTPVFSAPITRRESLVRWVAPVILSLPVVQGVGLVLRSRTAYAADDTLHLPSARPTGKPSPKPSAKPTRTGRCIVPPTGAPPTAAPAASPTLGMGAAPDARPDATSFVALGSARAASLGYIGR